MPKNLIAEREALLKALELAHHRINEAKKAQQEAEKKVHSLEAHLRTQETQLESMHRQFEKRAAEIAACEGHGDEHIHSLERKIGQGQAENQRLKALLLEAEAPARIDHEYLPAPKRGVHHERISIIHVDTPVEIDAAPLHQRRVR
jgi:chromosome segregation ATPase